MYPVSEAFKQAIIGRSRIVEWWGSITLKDGSVYNFTHANIQQNPQGTITRSCSSMSSIDLGGVYASELKIALRNLLIDRNSLLDAEIAVYSRIYYYESLTTWGEAAVFSWNDISHTRWGSSPKRIYIDVPMGVFTVSEAMRGVNSIVITAYDHMLNFDKALPKMDSVSRTCFEWLVWICDACDMTLGMTNIQVKALQNGSRSFVFADINTEVRTYRDLLSHLAIVLCSVATIDRVTGSLVLLQYGSTPVDTITTSLRYSSDFSDYETYYTGMYASFRAKSIQEYCRNVTESQDNGLVMDIGYNSFLQIANDNNRKIAIQEIINGLRHLHYTPFNITMPFNPYYDLMDILKFTGNQANNDIAPITSITYKINDRMTIQCGGENPRLSTAQTKESKAIDSLNDGVSVVGSSFMSTAFWILLNSYPVSEVEITDFTVTTELKLKCETEHTRTQIAWTGAYTLDEDAVVTVDVRIDGVSIYCLSDTQTAGAHVLSISTGYEFDTVGERTVRVYLKEEPLE